MGDVSEGHQEALVARWDAQGAEEARLEGGPGPEPVSTFPLHSHSV